MEPGDRQSPTWAPFHGTDGTPNESANDVRNQEGSISELLSSESAFLLFES